MKDREKNPDLFPEDPEARTEPVFFRNGRMTRPRLFVIKISQTGLLSLCRQGRGGGARPGHRGTRIPGTARQDMQETQFLAFSHPPFFVPGHSMVVSSQEPGPAPFRA